VVTNWLPSGHAADRRLVEAYRRPAEDRQPVGLLVA